MRSPPSEPSQSLYDSQSGQRWVWSTGRLRRTEHSAGPDADAELLPGEADGELHLAVDAYRTVGPVRTLPPNDDASGWRDGRCRSRDGRTSPSTRKSPSESIGGRLVRGRVIESPLWSSLTTGHGPTQAIAEHDPYCTSSALTSVNAGTKGRWITRLPVSGLHIVSDAASCPLRVVLPDER